MPGVRDAATMSASFVRWRASLAGGRAARLRVDATISSTRASQKYSKIRNLTGVRVSINGETLDASKDFRACLSMDGNFSGQGGGDKVPASHKVKLKRSPKLGAVRK